MERRPRTMVEMAIRGTEKSVDRRRLIASRIAAWGDIQS
jgi:hypothetical protein